MDHTRSAWITCVYVGLFQVPLSEIMLVTQVFSHAYVQ